MYFVSQLQASSSYVKLSYLLSDSNDFEGKTPARCLRNYGNTLFTDVIGSYEA